MKNKRGISLIVLVITIVVIIILATTVIVSLVGENGIISQANRAKEENNMSAIKEEISMIWLDTYTKGILNNFGRLEVCKYFDEQLKKQDSNATAKDMKKYIDIYYKKYNIAIDYTGKILDISKDIVSNTKIVHISGENLKIGLDDKGTIWTFGVNGKQMKKLGDDFNNSINNVKIVQSSSGIAIDENGKVWTWGENNDNQIGDGTDEYKDMPICISDIPDNPLNGKKIIQVVSGIRNMTALDENGKVWTWGSDSDTGLGNGTLHSTAIPTCISDLPDNPLNGKKIIQISNRIALDENGKVWTWGFNSSGQVGDGTNTESELPICISDITTNPLNGKKIIQISEGIALEENGKVWTWGYNGSGSLGAGIDKKQSNIPICISDIAGNPLNGKEIVKVQRYEYVMALDKDGKLWTWGYNEYGSLGNGTNENSNIPICISNISGNPLNGKKIIDVSIYRHTSTILDENGKVWTWGDCGIGDLGDATYSARNIPICISDISGNPLNGKKITKLGINSTSAIEENNNLWIWGERGKNSNIPICINKLVLHDISKAKIVKISTNYNSIIALDSEGKVWTWGKNIGDGTDTISYFPTCISNIIGNPLYGVKIIDVSANYESNALDEHGNIWTWDTSGYSSETNTSIPVIINDNGVEIVKLMKRSNSGVDKDGKLWDWSRSYFGSFQDEIGSPLYSKKIIDMSYKGDVGIVLLEDNGKVWYHSNDIIICISDIPGNLLNGKKMLQTASVGYVIDENNEVLMWDPFDDSFRISNLSLFFPEIAGKKIIEMEVDYECLILLDDTGKVHILDISSF